MAAYLKSFELNEQGSERIVILVENRIEVRKGYGEAILERFRTPKNVHTFPGFIRMDVLHAENADGNEEIRVCTTWENEAAFQGWANSDSFRGAHAKRAEQANAQGQAQPHGQGHGHGGRHGEAEGAESASPIIGNKVTIYQVVASHLPAPAQAASEA
ncbi:antibiotic biosynthesis monooxygenase [Paenibacillus methanolicus]|uniref:antibiotic biosynthesis monooxygenase n=1 Tax=Paenibacillus methanolicus TaxID=582686 RepID=UPI001FEAA434|nr:antibiotic biosynthesis monooxygenase [Paenibacillus methanolicus]